VLIVARVLGQFVVGPGRQRGQLVVARVSQRLALGTFALSLRFQSGQFLAKTDTT